ncbi:MAG: MFS transporter [Holosporaceae bacterium]
MSFGNSADAPTGTPKLSLFCVLILIASIPHLGSDIYTPSLPAMAAVFNVGLNTTQLTLSLYLSALTVSQLFWGPVAHRFGQGFALKIGLVLSLIGALACTWVESFTGLLVIRLLHGFANGAMMALWRSMLSGLYRGRQLARAASQLSFFIIFILAAAPFLGGFFQQFFTWQLSFLFLAAWSAVTLFLLVYTFERPKQPAQSARWRQAYASLLGDPVFTGCCVCNLIAYAGLFAWITAGPSLLVANDQMSPLEYGFGVAITSLAGLLSAFFNAHLVQQKGVRLMLRFGWMLMILAGSSLTLTASLTLISPWTLIAFAFLFCTGAIFTFANMYALVFSRLQGNAALASSLYALIQVSGGAGISFLLSFIDETPSLLGIIFLLSGTLPLLLFSTLITKKS